MTTHDASITARSTATAATREELARWRQGLAAACARTTLFREATVLAEVASTQDAPETRAAHPGALVAALRQTQGRGRFGRAWEDTAEAGVAITFVIDVQPSERLVLASAVAAAEACERSLGRRVGIKWPNDIVVEGRKLSGVLIERRDERALVGIGINALQASFPEPLVRRATSLAMLGVRIDRLDLVAALVESLDRALVATDETLVAAFLERDALRGQRALFATPAGPVEGEVRSVDPMRGLVVRTESGERFLPAGSTSVAEWAGRPMK
jgi:BirA family biotin operon repressor/biotin-[acetyl-CoA-carboxylase] ligase